MRDSALWISIGSVATAILGIVYTYRAERDKTTVARHAGYVEGYDRLVDDLQADNTRLRKEIAELREEIKQLRADMGRARAEGMT